MCRRSMIEELFKDFEFYGNTNCDIEEIYGMKLPNDYLEFMHKYNGGEGDVGNYSYMQIVKLEDLIEFNNDYEMHEYFPGCFTFGTDLGGNLFCYNLKEKFYFSIDSCSISEEDMMFREHDFLGFIKAWDKQFEE